MYQGIIIDTWQNYRNPLPKKGVRCLCWKNRLLEKIWKRWEKFRAWIARKRWMKMESKGPAKEREGTKFAFLLPLSGDISWQEHRRYRYPHTNGQKTNGIFNSYQNSDSLGFCPLVPSPFPFHHRGLVGLSAYNSYASVQSLFLSCAVSTLLRLAPLLTVNTSV